MIQQFLQLDPDKYPIIQQIFDHVKQGNNVYGIQADGDEFPTAEVIHHMKHCVIKSNIESIYLPCFSMKSNLYWLQKTYDMENFMLNQNDFDVIHSGKCKERNMNNNNDAGTNKKDCENILIKKELNSFLWRLGPYLVSWSYIIKNKHLGRRILTNTTPPLHHTGYGSALHMSAFIDPAEYWLKLCGTIENYYACTHKFMNSKLLIAGQSQVITKEIVYQSTIYPWCHKNNKAIHIQSLTLLSQQSMLNAIPWIIQNNPSSFPFILPSPHSLTSGILTSTSLPTWVSLCPAADKNLFKLISDFIKNIFV